jgi:thiol-disulfide isomerase/thioredoxin
MGNNDDCVRNYIKLGNRKLPMRLAAVLLSAVLLFGCIQQAGGPATPSGEARNPQQGGNQHAADEVDAQAGKLELAGGAGNASVPEAPVLDTSGVMMADYKPPEMQHFDFSDVVDREGRLIVYYFHSSGCSACTALHPEMERLMAAYPQAAWRDYDLAEMNGSMAWRDYTAQLNLSQSEKMVPQVLVNGTVISDRFKINASLEGILRNFAPGN